MSLILIAVAALTAPSSAVAAPKTLDVSPQQLVFGEQPFHTFTTKSFTVMHVSKKPVAVSIDTGFVPDDFSPGQPESTCVPFGSTTLGSGQSCTYVVGYYADPAAPSSVTAGSTSGWWHGRRGRSSQPKRSW